jgi:hypothetical protein
MLLQDAVQRRWFVRHLDLPVYTLNVSPAGKWGQLGHGDTSKRTVGRAVKQLKQSDVLQASGWKT